MFDQPQSFVSVLSSLPVASSVFQDFAAKRQNELTKPQGALGRLEEISIWLSGWQERKRLQIETVEGFLFAGNHGVVAEGISAYPAEVTAQMVANFEAGGAAINALARQFGHKLTVIPIALETPTRNFLHEPAMCEAETLEAINIGAGAVNSSEADLIYFGEMGIGNTTAASALAAVVFGGTGAEWAGPGTGLDGEGIARKAAVVDKALSQHLPDVQSAFDAMRLVGGRELAAIMGGVVAARLRRIPVLLDGFVVCGAAVPLALHGLETLEHCQIAHCSAEPGHQRLMDKLWMEPLLSLSMRLGEGSGAALAVELIRGAAATYNDMATFEEAAVAGKTRE